MKNKLRTTRLAGLAMVMTMLMAGCGGGGGDAGSTETYAVGQAWTNLYAANRSWTLSGTDNFGISYQFRQAHRTGTAGNFPVTGAAARRAFVDQTLTASGITSATGTTTVYFDPTSGALLGNQFVDGSDGSVSCARMGSPTPLPASAALGSGGSLGSVAYLSGCSASSPQEASGTAGWSLTLDAGIAYFCTNFATVDGSGTSTEEYCYETDTAGTIGTRSRVTLTAPVPGGELRLVMRNGG
jgi:hypothetical protein